MDLATIRELGYDILLFGAIALWAVVLLRIPRAAKSIPQRRLVIAAAGLAGSVTVYMDPVTAVLARTPLAGDCGIVMNVWGVLSSAFILDFVLAALCRRRPALVYGSAVFVCVTLVALNAVQGGQAGCVSSLNVAWYSPFWWLLSIAHVSATLPIMILCGLSAIETRNPWYRTGLVLLAAGFASSTFFWGAVVLGYLLTRSPVLGALFPLNVGLTAWLITAGTAVPLLARLSQRVREHAARRRLRPLWRRLVRVFPQVRLPAGALRGVESSAIDPVLYRTVIEIRDALLLLRDYVRPHDELAAREHAANSAEGDRDAFATACLIAVAVAAKENGYEPRRFSGTNDPVPDVATRDAWAAELDFQMALARLHRTPSVTDFARQRIPVLTSNPTRPVAAEEQPK